MKKRIFWERLSNNTKNTIIETDVSLYVGNTTDTKIVNFLNDWCPKHNIRYFRIWHSREGRFINVLEFDSVESYTEFYFKYM